MAFYGFALACVAACGSGDDDPGLSCLDNLPVSCTPSFPASYDQIYNQVFQQRCGTAGGGSSCHGSMGKKGGLDLSEPNAAYQQLLGSNGNPRVVPGDPKCSILVERLESADANVRMPYGEAPLSAGVRCAVQTWIQGGAARE